METRKSGVLIMWKRLKKSGYFKSLAILTSGSLVGTGITAIAEVARTWIFPAEEIGIYTFLIAFPIFIANSLVSQLKLFLIQ